MFNSIFQLKYFEPVWGDSIKSSNLIAPISNWSKPKHKKTETITAPANTPHVTTNVTADTVTTTTTITRTSTATTTCSSSDDVFTPSEKVSKSTDEIKAEDIKLELPWDSVDSTTDCTNLLIEEVILENVKYLIFIHILLLIISKLFMFNIY